jgi:peptidoglycan/xylan/chitin deacetylase (PgdA/CDA1 family)
MTLLPVRSLKGTALHSLKRSGCASLVGRSRWRRQRLLILAYHGVSQDDEHRWDGALYMSPEMLEERLWILDRSGCTVLPLDTAVERLYAGTLDDRSVAVTFDDGYVDFVTHAYPLLRKYRVPVTMYLPTLRVGWHAPVFPLVCSYMFWKSKGEFVQVPEIRSEPFDIGTAPARRSAVVAMLDHVKRTGMPRADREALVRRLAGRLAFDYDALVAKRLFQVMPPEDIKRLASNGVDFQLHTHTHNTPRDGELFRREIAVNRQSIRDLTGVDATHFCYPSGNYHHRFLPWLAELGVISATTCDPGLASAATPRLLLPRFVDTSNHSPIEFEGWVSGTSALLSRRRSYAARTA